jgi:hypothetical protein
MSSISTRRLLFSLLGVVLLVGVFILFNVNKVLIHDQLIALDLLPKPEKLTELYFNDGANLSSSVTANRSIQFSFVIHNLEATDYQYTYAISVNANSTRQIVDSGIAFVKNEQYYVKYEKFTLIQVSGRQNVVVELTNKRQSIDFWIS